MAKRRIHLGIDYGTSMSKIVIRDYGAPGGEQAAVVLNEGSYGFPSDVLLVDDTLAIGDLPKPDALPGSVPKRYTSIKMRVAAEVKGQDTRYCYGPLPALPDGVFAADLATLTVWWLISQGCRALGSNSEHALGMTLGVPMSFFNDVQLRAAFLRIARAAWFLFRQHGLLEPRPRIRIDNAREWLREAYERAAATEVLPEQVRDWIRAEAEAAMWWAFNSPDVPAGPYAKVDIGAGTTNASVFRIVDAKKGEKWVKEKLAFFGSASVPVGMDAVDEALAIWKGSDRAMAVMMRGAEEELLRQSGAQLACVEPISGIVRGFHEAWREGYRKNKGSQGEIQAWDGCQLFVIGGGSQVRPIREELTQHPDPNKRGRKLVFHDLSSPQDLRLHNGQRVLLHMLPFVQVAYGLSVIGLSIPEAKTPSEIPPLPKAETRVKFLDADDIYSK